MIPNKFHFIFGLKNDFGGKPFKLVHYLAIKSAIEVNKPEEVNIYLKYEPSGYYWDKIKPFLNIHFIEPPTEIFGNPLLHVAHQCGVMRIDILNKNGGIYLDCDTICVKPFTPLLNNITVMGIQGFGNNHIDGLCDGVILSQKESPYLDLWYNSYKSHRSKGRDSHWDEHAVRIPLKLAIQNPNIISVVSYDYFHYPLYTEQGIDMLFKENLSFPNAFCHHLWEQNSWDRYLNNLTEEHIQSIDTTYNRIARRFLK